MGYETEGTPKDVVHIVKSPSGRRASFQATPPPQPSLPVTIFQNGMMVKAGPFRPYTKQSAQVSS